jgi:hypothetical protein
MDEKKNKGGRKPSKANLFKHPLGMSLLKELAQRKATNDECCQAMGVSLNTWKRWKQANAELWATMGAKVILNDEDVEVSLFDSAKGFTKIIRKVVGDVLEIEERYYPPNVAATTFYLKNRKSDKWRDKIDIAASMEHIPVRINFRRKEKVVDAEAKVVVEEKVEAISSNENQEDFSPPE